MKGKTVKINNIFGAVLSAVACVLISVACLLIVSSTTTADDDGIRISGIGNSGNSFSLSAPIRLARKVKGLNIAPTISDDVLRSTLKALMDRAAQGDVEAAAFVVELACIQRAAPVGETAPKSQAK